MKMKVRMPGTNRVRGFGLRESGNGRAISPKIPRSSLGKSRGRNSPRFMHIADVIFMP